MFLRGPARLVSIEDVPEPGTEPAPSQTGDQAARLEQALGSLPNEQREVVGLKIDGGLTFAEIASVLGISESNAGTKLHRAVTKLREACDEAV